MYTHDLTNQSQSQAYPSKLPTSGFVYTKEWFKHPFLQFIRNSASGIFYGQTDIFPLPICGYSNLPVVILYNNLHSAAFGWRHK